MTDLQRAALEALRGVASAEVYDIATRIRRAHDAPHFHLNDLHAALHGLDDAGDVLMRNGRYRLSEKAKAKAGAA